jgi:hypothetical protein
VTLSSNPTNPSDVFRIRGGSLRTKCLYVADRFGETAAQNLARRIDVALKKPLLDTEWYPFALFERVLITIANDYLGGDLRRLDEVGEYMARLAIMGPFQASGTKDFQRLFQRLARARPRYYSHGWVDLETHSDGLGCDLRHHDVPRLSVADEHLTRGFYAACAEGCGLQGVVCQAVQHPGGAAFHLRWTAPEIAFKDPGSATTITLKSI